MKQKCRKIYRYIVAMLLCIILVVESTQVYKADTTSETDSKQPDIVAEAAVLIEAETGAVLYDKDSNKKLYPASITKIMTALLTLENTSMDDRIVFTSKMVNSVPYDASKMGAVSGEDISVNDGMYALMLRSYNDVAVGMAYLVAGSEEEFAKKMTERAHEIGAVNTNFMNATGLHHDEHYTTAYDMALIAREAMDNADFAKISGTLTYRILPTNKYEYRRTLNNSHELLSTTSEDYYSYAVAGKTGYTSLAGRTLVTIAKKDGVTLICVILKSTKESAGKDTKAILEYGFNSYAKVSVRDSENAADKNFFDEMKGAFISPQSAIYVNKDTFIMIPNGVEYEELTKKTVYQSQSLSGVIGELQYYYKDKFMGSVDILAASSTSVGTENGIGGDNPDNNADEKDMFEESSRISINVWNIVMAIAILIVLIIFIVYMVKTKEKRKRKRERKRIFRESKRRFKHRKKYR